MKKLLAIICLISLCGCTTTEKQDNCKAAKEVYTAYLLYVRVQEATGQPVDLQQVTIANGAAATLRLYCGWKQPSLPRNLSSIPNREPVDYNGVLVICPPR